jgi:hypothetical protein
MVLLASAAGAQVWKDKAIAQWTPEEARQVLTDSPWAKTVTPTLDQSIAPPRTTAGPGGVDIGGVGIGLPGMGRRGINGRTARGPQDARSDPAEMPKLKLRWASALPVSSAEFIAHELNAPAVDENDYAIAVYGLPGRMLTGDPESIGAELKKHAAIKREGKKDLKPSGVEVEMRDDGPVIVYLFPRGNEISRNDPQVEFDAEIGRLKIAQAFVPGEMVYRGKLEM